MLDCSLSADVLFQPRQSRSQGQRFRGRLPMARVLVVAIEGEGERRHGALAGRLLVRATAKEGHQDAALIVGQTSDEDAELVTEALSCGGNGGRVGRWS